MKAIMVLQLLRKFILPYLQRRDTNKGEVKAIMVARSATIIALRAIMASLLFGCNNQPF